MHTLFVSPYCTTTTSRITARCKQCLYLLMPPAICLSLFVHRNYSVYVFVFVNFPCSKVSSVVVVFSCESKEDVIKRLMAILSHPDNDLFVSLVRMPILFPGHNLKMLNLYIDTFIIGH